MLETLKSVPHCERRRVGKEIRVQRATRISSILLAVSNINPSDASAIGTIQLNKARKKRQENRGKIGILYTKIRLDNGSIRIMVGSADCTFQMQQSWKYMAFFIKPECFSE